MSNTKKYVSLDKLSLYNEKIKALIDSKDANILDSATDYVDQELGKYNTRLVAVEEDYLKASDKEDLQTQINTIMNNPDAEGAINSINEFTQYVADHGEIADGFRIDINKNKDDIAAEVERAGEAESALSIRLDTLEAIDHDAYVDADTALKNEINLELDKAAKKEYFDYSDANGAAIKISSNSRVHLSDGRLVNNGDSDSYTISAAGQYGTASLTINGLGSGLTYAYNLNSLVEDTITKQVAFTDDIPTGTLASKNAVSESDLDTTLATKLNGMTDADELAAAISAERALIDVELDKKVDKVDGKGLSTNDLTDELKNHYDAAYIHSQAAHAPVNAQANIIESVKVNGTALTVTDKAVDIAVPTDNSQLANGAGYLVANDIANKADKATTLAGYGIADAYTSAQTDTAISNAMSQFVEVTESEINALFA